MTTIATPTNVFTFFRPGRLPVIDPKNPEFAIVVGSSLVHVRITAKVARKLADHPGAARLVGRLDTDDEGRLYLADAGFQFIPPREEVTA